MNIIKNFATIEPETINQLKTNQTQTNTPLKLKHKLPSLKKRNLALIKNNNISNSFKSVIASNVRTISQSSSTRNMSEPATLRKGFLTALQGKQKKELTPSKSSRTISKSPYNSLPKIKRRNCLKIKKPVHQNLDELYDDYLNVDNSKLTIDEQKTFDYYIPKTSIPQKPLLKLYQISSKQIVKKYKIKKNNHIALQNDFEIKGYQNMLMGFVGKNTRKHYLLGMRDKFSEINKIGEYKSRMKSNWQYLIDKIDNKVSQSLILKLQSLVHKKFNKSG